MSDFDKAEWQNVEQKASDELYRIQRHDLNPIAVLGVPPLKSDLTVFEAQQPAVGDGHAVRVAGQILQYIFRPAERWFRIDHPLDTFQLSQQGVKAGELAKRNQLSVEFEFAVRKSIAQQSQKLASEQLAQHRYR